MTVAGSQQPTESSTARVGRSRRPRSRVPMALMPLAVLGMFFLVVPLIGIVIEVPWSRFSGLLTSQEVLQPLKLSLVTASIATGLCLVFGVPLAWLLARGSVPGSRVIRSLLTVPLTLPPVVGGVALLMVFGRDGLLGQYAREWFGISLPFTTAAVVVAQAFVAMPFLVMAVDGALRTADSRYEEAAVTLGASRWYLFRRVTLPMVAPGVAAGAVLCWARALGEFGATITFAGNFPGITQTMPLSIYLAFETDPEIALVLSFVLLTVAVIVLASLRSRWISSAGST